MGSVGDRLGKFDDESVIYRADDPDQKVHWPRVAVANVVGSILAALVLAGATRLLGDVAGILLSLVLGIAYMVLYVIWRRRRNKRLTGSATTWPSS